MSAGNFVIPRVESRMARTRSLVVVKTTGAQVARGTTRARFPDPSRIHISNRSGTYSETHFGRISRTKSEVNGLARFAATIFLGGQSAQTMRIIARWSVSASVVLRARNLGGIILARGINGTHRKNLREFDGEVSARFCVTVTLRSALRRPCREV